MVDKDSSVQEILEYWYGRPNSNESDEDAAKRKRLWFGANPEDDSHMKEHFGELISQAKAGELQVWATDDKASMALILLTDQMTRATGRGTADAFAGDPVALATCKLGIEAGRHMRIPSDWRMFYFMPLEHSESLDDQNRCVELTEQFASEMGASEEFKQGVIKYAIEHRDIIERFGRFPHRNQLLGRESTPEEQEYLASGAATFGQKAKKG